MRAQVRTEALSAFTITPGNTVPSRAVCSTPRDLTKNTGNRKKLVRQDMLLRECEEYLQDSRRLRDVASSKATRQIKTG